MPKPASTIAFAFCAATLCACGPAPAARPSPAATATAAVTASPAPEPHHHEHAPPHGGTLVELGEELAHVEVVFDRAAGCLTVYLLDGDAEGPVRTRQEKIAARLERLDIDGRPLPGLTPVALFLAPAASALTGETAGDASQLAACDPVLRGHARLRGALERVEAKGRSFDAVAFELGP